MTWLRLRATPRSARHVRQPRSWSIQKESVMRSAFSILLFWIVAIAGCATAGDPQTTDPAASGTSDELGSACPHICGEGTLCLHPNGTCSEACNPCLCQASGGKVV